MGEADCWHPEVNGQGSGSEGLGVYTSLGGFEPECEESEMRLQQNRASG